MKTVRTLISLMMALAMMLSAPLTGFAAETESSDAPETTEVTVADSPEEISRESEAAYDNDAFFTIDASEKSTSAVFATDEVSGNVSDILSGNGSVSKKQEEIADALEESGYYQAEGSGKTEVDVTSKFAYQRLILVANREEEINAFGAVRAVYFEGSYLLSYDSMEATKAAYDALVREYGDEAVIIDVPLRLNAAAKGWGTEFMNMSYEKNYAGNSSPVTVAVIDTGITYSHEVFSGREILDGYDFVNNDDDPADDNTGKDGTDKGHGTAVSGVIAESTPSNVKIMPLKALDRNGEGSLYDILSAAEYADNNGADIINMSLGGDMDAYTMAYCENSLKDLSALLICAAGNEAEDMDQEGVNKFPAELSSAVCVGSITSNRSRSYFSNYGKAVDFAAPGSTVQLADLYGSYSYMSGTSFSSPYLAAAAALVKAGHDDYSNSEIVSHLIGISEDIGNDGKDRYFGNGCPIFPQHQRGGSISGEGVTNSIRGLKNKTYTGKAQTQDLTLTVNGERLIKDTDYSVEYKDNVDAGTAGIRITGKGDYYGTIEGVTFRIYPKSIAPSITLSASEFSYTGSAITPDVTVRDGSTVLKNGADYTVSYTGNIDAGTAAVTVTCRGNYSGSGKASFTITDVRDNEPSGGNTVYTPVPETVSIPAVVPAGTGLKKLSGASKAITVKWKKQTARILGRRITGYQVQTALDPAFTQAVKTANVKGCRKTSKKIGKLAKKTRYYVRVRTYMKYNGAVYYSAWSGVKSAKTK